MKCVLFVINVQVHELLGIKNHRVNMESVPDAGIVLLSPLQDAFYAKVDELIASI